MFWRAEQTPLSMAEERAAFAAWLDERCGKLTGSRMSDAIAYKKKNGEPMQCRMDYMRDILTERATGLSIRHYVTSEMQWGLDHEAEGKMAYSTATGIKLLPSRFYDHPEINWFGATPDAEIPGGEGLMELKCPTTRTFMTWKMAGVVPDEHKPQMVAELVCTGRRWCDFVAYDPRIRDEGRRIFIRRFEPSQEERQFIEAQAEKFLKEVDVLWNEWVNAA